MNKDFKTNFYIKTSFKFENKTRDEMVKFIEELNKLAKGHDSKETLGSIKKNSVYDSFLYSWE